MHKIVLNSKKHKILYYLKQNLKRTTKKLIFFEKRTLVLNILGTFFLIIIIITQITLSNTLTIIFPEFRGFTINLHQSGRLFKRELKTYLQTNLSQLFHTLTHYFIKKA